MQIDHHKGVIYSPCAVPKVAAIFYFRPIRADCPDFQAGSWVQQFPPQNYLSVVRQSLPIMNIEKVVYIIFNPEILSPDKVAYYRGPHNNTAVPHSLRFYNNFTFIKIIKHHIRRSGTAYRFIIIADGNDMHEIQAFPLFWVGIVFKSLNRISGFVFPQP